MDAEDIVLLIFSFLCSAAFGVWQHSLSAFMFLFLLIIIFHKK